MFLKLFFILLVSFPLFAKQSSARIDTSSTNITVNFNGTNGFVPLASMQQIQVLQVDNRTATEIAVNCSTVSGTAPSDTSTNNVYINAGQTWSTGYGELMASACYVRSMSGTISSGVIVVSVGGY